MKCITQYKHLENIPKQRPMKKILPDQVR